MPKYDYQCQDCLERFSLRLSISERKNAICPKCSSKQVRQVFTCCNVMGGKASSSAFAGNSSGCSRTGGCSGCAGCN